MQHTIPKKVLIAPLYWGLGHTVRCIPIITYLEQKGCQIFIASAPQQQNLLAQHFSQLQYLDAPFVKMEYGKTKLTTLLKYLLLLPKLLRSFRQETNWLRAQQEEHQFDIVFSDNRYGMYNKNCYTIFITHQLAPIVPIGKTFAHKLLYKYINRFNACWVLDEQGNDALAPLLSQPAILPKIPTKYIGIISRLRKLPDRVKNYEACIVLSGPEPQRSILEHKLLSTLPPNGRFVLVRGTDEPLKISLPKNVEVVNIAHSKTIQELVQSSQYVISRSGYTSVMDWALLGIKAIIVPTPAQYEQEYLGNYLHQKKIMMQMLQHHFNATEALYNAALFQYSKSNVSNQNKLTTQLDALMQI
jgi:uncharacterized protein (TIGR00661 family)